MRMEQTEGGCLKILLSGEDLKKHALSYDTLDYRNAATRDALRHWIRTAAETLGFAPTEHMRIEAVPLDDGCLLLVTPEKTGFRWRIRRTYGPYVYWVDSADRLLQLGAAAARLKQGGVGFFGSSSLYRTEGDYCLVLYPIKALSPPLTQLLHSLAVPAGEGDPAAAFAAEHGAPVTVGDALDRLCAAYSE